MLRWKFRSRREIEIPPEKYCKWRGKHQRIKYSSYAARPRSYSSSKTRRRKFSDVPDNAKVFESKLSFCISQTFIILFGVQFLLLFNRKLYDISNEG